jgi:response regulator RpfG family c-di-GMP phosphodiesterase
MRNDFDLDTAGSGDEGLALIQSSGPYAVVVSDMRMPGMNGVEFLEKARSLAPDTVRVMLTGNADQQTAVDAVNKGDVFRFLNKPCEQKSLAGTVTAALRQHQLITAERDLLENTLRGSIKALTDILALTNPEVFGSATRHKRYMKRLVESLGLAADWQYEAIATLSQLGCITIAPDIVRKRYAGHLLSDDEYEAFVAHAIVGSDILSTIPRLDTVADAVRYQEKNFNGTGYPDDKISGEKIPLGARLLKVIIDYDLLESSGSAASEALSQMRKRAGHYDPAVLSALGTILKRDTNLVTRTYRIAVLADGMLLADDIYTKAGILLVSKGQETTLSVRKHLMNYNSMKQIDDEVQVLDKPE